jgi:DGQHR domain-containing protein
MADQIMKTKLQPFKQENTQMYAGTMSVGELLDKTEVDVYRKENDQELGYQRTPEASRAMKVAKYLKTDPKPLIPTAVLLSYRGTLPREPISNIDSSDFVSVDIPDDQKLWVIDGQHRLFGFRKAIEELGIERLRDYRLPVVIVENPSIAEEANQFRVINETMKKVRTDLARHILVMKIAKEGAPARRAVRELGRIWESNSVEICKVLNEHSDSPWLGRIQMPNEKKTPEHVVRELSFSTSLKPLLNDVTYKTYPSKRIATMLMNYWNAWKELVPAAFETPDDYVLMKTPGVFSCHSLALHVFEILRARGLTEPGVEDFKTILLDLEDYVTAEKWEKNNQEGPAMAGSMKGFSLTAEAMYETLAEQGHSR